MRGVPHRLKCFCFTIMIFIAPAAHLRGIVRCVTHLYVRGTGQLYTTTTKILFPIDTNTGKNTLLTLREKYAPLYGNNHV